MIKPIRALPIYPPPDFRVEDNGSILIFYAQSQAARDLLAGQLGGSLDDWQRVGPCGFALDHRVANALVTQLQSEGFTVQ